MEDLRFLDNPYIPTSWSFTDLVDFGRDYARKEFKRELDQARVEHRERLKEFRATEFVMVGPTVTCRGKTIIGPVEVPLDAEAVLARQVADAWQGLKSGFEAVTRQFQSVAGVIVDAMKSFDGLIQENNGGK